MFSLKVHPIHKWYTQCLDFRFNPGYDTRFYKIAFLCYQIFVSSITFFLPLIVIIFTYSGIIQKMITKLNTKSTYIERTNDGRTNRHNNNKQKKNRNNRNGNNTTNNKNNAQDLSNNNNLLFSKTRQDTMKKAKRKTLKLAITIGIYNSIMLDRLLKKSNTIQTYYILFFVKLSFF